MSRPLVLIHGYSASGVDFEPLRKVLLAKGIDATDLNIGNYISLNNEITIKDIAEAFDRAIRHTHNLDEEQPFDAIVHSTGMLVIRSWLTNYGIAVQNNPRLKRLKHLIGVAPATWGSPQAHKGRTWLGALVKGDRRIGPDFLNAGDQVLDGLELGSRFTWDLAHADLLGAAPYYSTGPNTPFVSIFIGNVPYTGLSSVANDPGTDGTVRWSGCSLNTRKIIVDLTRTPVDKAGAPSSRVSMTKWASDRLDVPLLPIEGRNHASLISEPDSTMVDLIVDFLKVADPGQETFDSWLARAKTETDPAWKKMLVDPGGNAAGITEAVKTYIGDFFHLAGKTMKGWQQFVVHARDERGDGVSDYLIEVLAKEGNDWNPLKEMYTDVHPYTTDPSYRCFHIRLHDDILNGTLPLKLRIHASTGTDLMQYQGYGSDNVGTDMSATGGPVEISLGPLNAAGDTLFHPFTTTLVEIILNRSPSPLTGISRLFGFLPDGTANPPVQ